MSGHHKGWYVRQPGSKPVPYPSYRRARRTAKQLAGGQVRHGACLILLPLLPFLALAALLRDTPPRRHGPPQTTKRPVLESGSPASYAICKICRSGIYDQQPRVWLSKPAGLSHTTCASTAAVAAVGAR